MSTSQQYKPVHIKTNPKYHCDGTKSYVYCMSKYRFTGTLGGKYHQGMVMRQQGKYGGEDGHQAVGGKLRKVQVLEKTTGSGVDSETGLVGAEDVQNDSLYLAEVEIGKLIAQGVVM